MTKSLMIPVRPQHAVNILNGKKTLDLRKWIPKDYVGWVYVYVTKGKPYLLEECADEYWNTIYQTYDKPFSDRDLNGKVVARFWFDEYYTYHHYNHGVGLYNDDAEYNVMYDDLEKLCLDYREIENYGKGKVLYAWHIKKLEIFDEPKELSDFIVGITYFRITITGNILPPTYKKLEKPPKRSVWVYTREMEE